MVCGGRLLYSTARDYGGTHQGPWTQYSAQGCTARDYGGGLLIGTARDYGGRPLHCLQQYKSCGGATHPPHPTLSTNWSPLCSLFLSHISHKSLSIVQHLFDKSGAFASLKVEYLIPYILVGLNHLIWCHLFTFKQTLVIWWME